MFHFKRRGIHAPFQVHVSQALFSTSLQVRSWPIQMAEDFELAAAVESVPDSEKEVAQELRPSLNPEDVEVSKEFVEGQLQLFRNYLSGVVQKACAENDLREQWLSNHYFITLKDFSTMLKNAYVPHVRQDAVPDEVWKRAE